MKSRRSTTCGCGPWPWRGRMPSCGGAPNQSTPSGAFTTWWRHTRVLAASACSWVQLAAPGRAPVARVALAHAGRVEELARLRGLLLVHGYHGCGKRVAVALVVGRAEAVEPALARGDEEPFVRRDQPGGRAGDAPFPDRPNPR